MVRLMLVAVEQRDERVGVVLGGCRRDELRQAAVRVCAKRFGGGDWCVCEERFSPTMVSRTGSVRLWEARFELERSSYAYEMNSSSDPSGSRK
jgi:hypothetical protein